MMRGVYVAYAVVSWCYFGVSIAGYWAFGNGVGSNVIFSIGHPKWMVAMADLFVTVHVIGSYQVPSYHSGLLNCMGCRIERVHHNHDSHPVVYMFDCSCMFCKCAKPAGP